MENTVNADTETTTVESVVPERSNPITVGPDQGGNVLAAWRGVYHLFGGQVERWDITHDGIVAVGFTVDGQYEPQAIVNDISSRERRAELIPCYFYAQGEVPAPFDNSLEMTKWMQQFFRKVSDEGKSQSPDYVKHAIASYKKANAFPAKRGRPKKVVRIEQLGSLDESLLAGVNVSELEKLQEKIAHAIANKQS